MLPLKLILASTFAAVLIYCTGCSNQPTHPNQVNAFDGSSYDSLTVAHAALVSLRTPVSTSQRHYISPFNEAAATYATAYSAYAAYRTAQTNQPALALAIANLTASITSLENTMQADMQPSAADIAKVNAAATQFRSTIGQRLTISEILTELEIAASIAATIPAAGPYATLAEIVIRMAQEALAAFSASSGQPIDLTTIQPVAPIQ